MKNVNAQNYYLNPFTSNLNIENVRYFKKIITSAKKL